MSFNENFLSLRPQMADTISLSQGKIKTIANSLYVFDRHLIVSAMHSFLFVIGRQATRVLRTMLVTE